MSLFITAVPVMAVSTIFCVWHAYRNALHRHHRLVRERVAYMLWVLGTTSPSREVRALS